MQDEGVVEVGEEGQALGGREGGDGGEWQVCGVEWEVSRMRE